MTPAELEAIAEAVARKLAPKLTTPLRLRRKRMASMLDVSSRTLQSWTNQPDNPCPCHCEGTVILYDPAAVEAWLSVNTSKDAFPRHGGNGAGGRRFDPGLPDRKTNGGPRAAKEQDQC